MWFSSSFPMCYSLFLFGSWYLWAMEGIGVISHMINQLAAIISKICDHLRNQSTDGDGKHFRSSIMRLWVGVTKKAKRTTTLRKDQKENRYHLEIFIMWLLFLFVLLLVSLLVYCFCDLWNIFELIFRMITQLVVVIILLII